MYSLQTLFDYLLDVQITELRICRLFCDNIGELRNEFVKLYFNKLKTGEAGPSAVFDYITIKYTKFNASNLVSEYARRRKNRVGNSNKEENTNNKKNNYDNKKGPRGNNTTGRMDSNTFKKR